MLGDIGFTQEMKDAPVTSLSGGWRMKLALARAMIIKADIMLLDEPTNHLVRAAPRACLCAPCLCAPCLCAPCLCAPCLCAPCAPCLAPDTARPCPSSSSPPPRT